MEIKITLFSDKKITPFGALIETSEGDKKVVCTRTYGRMGDFVYNLNSKLRDIFSDKTDLSFPALDSLNEN